MTDRIVDEVGGSPVRSRRVHDRAGDGTPLPVPLTTFIGRQHDVAGVSDLILRHDVRLVTLAGPAGVGKTRLAIRVASEVSDRFADGVRFVALGSVMDVDLVVPTIARDMGVWETSSETVTDRLIGSLLGPAYPGDDRESFDISPDGSTLMFDLKGATWFIDLATGEATKSTEYLPNQPSWQRR